MRIEGILRLIALSLMMCSCGVTRYSANADYCRIDASYGYDGILEERFHDCSISGPTKRRMYVYLPSDYYKSDKRYPVFYLLHGARGNEMSWIVKGDFLHQVDSLIASGKMEETIIVLPNTNQYKSDRDYGKSRIKGAIESYFEVDGSVESVFVNDVVKSVDSHYRTIPTKHSRAIGGLSIGALQAIYITAAHPDMFGYVGLFSPMLHPALRYGEYASFYKHLKNKQKLQFETPPHLYWVMIGKKDFFYPRMNAYCKYLARHSYDYQYLTTTGGHDWYNWVNYCNMFMARLWR